jgi:hypothetical protein
MLVYAPHEYNHYDVLKVPISLVLINLYALKHYLIFAMPIMSSIPMIGAIAQPIAQVMPSPDHSTGALLFSSLPALFVLISMARRLPQARNLMRWLWQRGHWLLITSLSLEIGLLTLYTILGIKKLNDIILLGIYLNVILIFYLVKSTRVRDVFAEFPQPLNK